ncbi:DUF2894 domain-containing protein [Aquincola sp. S2]|uniref:DUF2894 domain-containing protein n=1 Tax=Pseudaquabacterium terrae TaxID=2732868 RepID=A0ABX2EG52_9BURK|nr:DUF2894 domain-containing protein [Aquabacterium terrae]NRF67582.1 DUF2894 domain-containing protein [Aquabacterium terrae]
MAAPSPGSDPGLILAALRERGAQRFEPVRFRFIEALARRAAAHEGAVKRVLDERLAALVAAYVEQHDTAAPAAACSPQRPAPSYRGPLAELAGAGRPAELQALAYFRSTWARLRIHRQLRQSLAKVPENAGPLNSHRLVLRALQAMREVSPAYLDRFMPYVDALLWLELAGSARPEPPKRPGARR